MSLTDASSESAPLVMRLVTSIVSSVATRPAGGLIAIRTRQTPAAGGPSNQACGDQLVALKGTTAEAPSGSLASVPDEHPACNGRAGVGASDP